MTKPKAKEDLEKVGRKLIFKNPKQLEKKIKEYLENCPDTRFIVLKDSDGGTYLEKIPCITICGLALYLGFESRQSLYDYERRPEFSCIIKKARTFVEFEYEKMLHNAQCTGAIFALKNMKWSDSPKEEEKAEGAVTLEGVVANKNAISNLLMPSEGDNGTSV